MTQGYQEFEFDLPDALLKSIIVAFDGIEAAPLAHEDVEAIPDGQGVYMLLFNEEIVYVGKTDSESGLKGRLKRHAWNIQHRNNLSVDQMSFKAVRVFVFTAMDLETQLIRHYRQNYQVSWNNSGFGSNDPGRKRDHTQENPDNFDTQFPLDLDKEIELPLKGHVSLLQVIRTLKDFLPYTLRIQRVSARSHKLHGDFDDRFMDISSASTTARELLLQVLAQLPKGWQATALAGRVILYKEHVDDYPGNRVIGRS